MAQSAVKERALLGIKHFWVKPTLEPPLRWDRWQIMLKWAILAKEGISIDTLREDPLDEVTFPPEPIYENNVENSTSQSERDRKTRNEQLKNAWLNRCQQIELAGTLCGDKPWKFCDNKAVSLTFLSLGIEGRRIFGSQEPNIQIDRVTTLGEPRAGIYQTAKYYLRSIHLPHQETIERRTCRNILRLSSGTIFELRFRKS